MFEIQGTQINSRLISLDALRGFDMFWIVGGDYLIKSLRKIHDNSLTRELYNQMEHVAYEGFHFYDFIFPLFIFIVGISITLSLSGKIQKNGKSAVYKRIIIRTVILFFLGVFYMGGIKHGVENIYLAGVLQRIAVAYFFGAVLFCLFNNRSLILIIILLLTGYYASLTFIPVPNLGEASFEQGKNLAHYIDQWLPGQKFEGTILSTLGAIANVLIGVIVGIFLKNLKFSNQKKVVGLIVSGICCLILGYVWGIWFPIIKAIWTSSYVLVASGYGMLLLGFFYQLIEIWNFKKWAIPFIWIGMNPITIYITASLLNFRRLSLRFVGGEVNDFFSNFSELIISVITLLFVFWLAGFLYKKKIFIRI